VAFYGMRWIVFNMIQSISINLEIIQDHLK